jgi:hypothetical protein
VVSVEGEISAVGHAFFSWFLGIIPVRSRKTEDRGQKTDTSRMGEIIEVEDPAFLGRNGGQKQIKSLP